MLKMTGAVLLAAVAFGFLAFSVSNSGLADDTKFALKPRSQAPVAPNFSMRDSAGSQVVTLTDVERRTPVVVSFWATWCGPCRMELPHLEELSKQYAGRVQFYGIDASDEPQTTESFRQQNGLTFTTLMDTDHRTADAYGVHAFPTLLVIDRAGTVRFGMVGFDPDMPQQLPKLLDKLLAEGG